MDIQAITTAISTLGFPIFCVIYLLQSQTKVHELHAQEAKAWTEALHNNTIALTQLTDFIKSAMGGKKE